MSDLKQALTEVVRSRGLQRLPEPVKLASGAFSSDFIDGKEALSRPEDFKLAAQAALRALDERGIEFDTVGGLIFGAAPLALHIANAGDRSWFIVRKIPKDRGNNKLVEGITLERNTRVLLVDDVVTTGGSIQRAYAAIKDTGATMVAAIALVDRAGLAASWFEERNIPYIPLVTYRDLDIEPVCPPDNFASDDLALVEALAIDGFSAVRPEQLGDLAAACQETCETTGDGRYCILANAFSAIDNWWSEHNESGGVPFDIARDLERVLRSHLLPVLRSDSLAEAAMLATMLRREIEPKLVGPSGWRI